MLYSWGWFVKKLYVFIVRRVFAYFGVSGTLIGITYKVGYFGGYNSTFVTVFTSGFIFGFVSGCLVLIYA